MERQSDRILLLEPAQRQIEEIAQVHLQLVGPDSARKITNKIYGSLERLEQFPLLGVLLEDKQLRRDGYRMVISGDYLCFYRLIEEVVFVYYIVHGATDCPGLLKDQRKQ